MEFLKPLSPVVPVFFAHYGRLRFRPSLRIFGCRCGHCVNLVDAQGINRQLLLLYGSLPAAVVNFVLTEKYGQDPELAASIVVLSTLISVMTIPLVFWLIL